MILETMFTPFHQELQKRGTTCFSVRVRPNAARTEAFSVLEDGSIKMNVAAPPEKGKANRELLKHLAKEFGVPRSHVAIISGAADRHKMIQVHRLFP